MVCRSSHNVVRSSVLFTVISSSDYIEFVLPYEKEDRLPLMLTYLNVRARYKM